MRHMGELVKEKRLEKKWSVAWLELKSGVDRTIIYRIEKKGSGFVETYEKLFRAMGYELKRYR